MKKFPSVKISAAAIFFSFSMSPLLAYAPKPGGSSSTSHTSSGGGSAAAHGGGGGGAGTLQFVSFEDLGVGAGVGVVGLLGFRITLFGQLRSGGLFDLYFGIVDAVVAVVLLSEELLGATLL